MSERKSDQSCPIFQITSEGVYGQRKTLSESENLQFGLETGPIRMIALGPQKNRECSLESKISPF